MKTLNDTLNTLQRRMFEYYKAYRSGEISQSEYLFRIRPIDREIEKIEIFFLKHLKPRSK